MESDYEKTVLLPKTLHAKLPKMLHSYLPFTIVKSYNGVLQY